MVHDGSVDIPVTFLVDAQGEGEKLCELGAQGGQRKDGKWHWCPELRRWEPFGLRDDSKGSSALHWRGLQASKGLLEVTGSVRAAREVEQVAAPF